MDENTSNKSFGLDDIPEDAKVYTSENSFEPVEEDTYQAILDKAELKQNIFYKEGAPGSKYQFSFTFKILNNDHEGRLVWENAGLSLKPMTNKGPTKLYKLVTKILGNEMSWEECGEFAPDVRTLYQNILTKLVGRQIVITTENVPTKTGKVRTKIVAYKTPKQDLDVPTEDGDTPPVDEDIDFS